MMLQFIFLQKSCSPPLNICKKIKQDNRIHHDGVLEHITKQNILLWSPLEKEIHERNFFITETECLKIA